MQTRGFLVVLLLLECSWGLHGSPVSSEVLPTAQENFDLDKLLGRWYEVAVVSTCPYYMQAQRDNPAMVKYELQKNSTRDIVVQMRGTVPRQGTCKQISVDFTLTNTSGRFYHHFARFNADVDSYVVRTDYDAFAMWVVLSTEQPSAVKSTLVKLYSRATDVRESVLTEYRALVRNQGMSEDVIIIKDNKGECEQINSPV